MKCYLEYELLTNIFGQENQFIFCLVCCRKSDMYLFSMQNKFWIFIGLCLFRISQQYELMAMRWYLSSKKYLAGKILLKAMNNVEILDRFKRRYNVVVVHRQIAIIWWIT